MLFTQPFVHRSSVFIITASDLQPVHTGNALIKFADDTYVIVLADNSDTSTSELMNIKSWYEDNKLKLNCTKCKETGKMT